MRHFILACILFITLPINWSSVSAQIGVNSVKLPVVMIIPAGAKLSLYGSDMLFSIKGKGTQQVISPKSVGEVWINYSSLVESNSTNQITANLTTFNLPAEVAIKLRVGPDAGAGYGQTGSPLNVITLSPFPQTIISNIGSCYTGQGLNKGHQLFYTWQLRPLYDDEIFDEANIDKLQVAVTYTITSNE